MNDLEKEWEELLSKTRSILKAKRAFIRSRRWTEADWYKNWPAVGDALEAVLRRSKI